ncbi:MAG: hypothetical protein IPQ06_03950 [Chitinophagaceae bacterium]|nr:hypothetical protein [Chitinophagaceae bacterium]
MNKLILSLLFFIGPTEGFLHAQDTLPKFSVNNAGNNRIIIGWVNNYENIRQISIQRSFDSLSGFKSILTVADPTTKQNGYADMKASNGRMFYRLYVLLDKGVYIFTDAKRPVLDTMRKATILTIKLDQFPGADSVATPNPGISKTRPNAFTPSIYVYTYRDGYVRISLPDDEKPKKYSIKFFDDDQTFLFELKEIKEKDFKLDKTNFYHAGWFRFELYEDGKLFEKHKFYLEKDF